METIREARSDVTIFTRIDKNGQDQERVGPTSEGQHRWDGLERKHEARLRWYGHVLRKDDGYIGRRMLRIELPGKRKRGRPKRGFMDAVRQDMAVVGMT